VKQFNRVSEVVNKRRNPRLKKSCFRPQRLKASLKQMTVTVSLKAYLKYESLSFDAGLFQPACSILEQAAERHILRRIAGENPYSLEGGYRSAESSSPPKVGVFPQPLCGFSRVPLDRVPPFETVTSVIRETRPRGLIIRNLLGKQG
jgi:hypothetical protein